MMDLDDRLRAHMDAEMSTTRVSNLGAVMERGEVLHRRRRVRSAVLPATAVVVVVAGVALSQQSRGGDRELPEVDAVAAANAQLSVQPASLDWETRPAALGWQLQNVAADGVLYALSTAPGVRWEDFPNGDLPKAIYASTDGTNWSSHPVGGSWVSSIAAADGLLYAVGTGPGAEEDSITLRIGVSADQGASFSDTNIPLAPVEPASVTTKVMATPQGVLATATSRNSIDPISLLPPDVLDGPVEPVTLEEGIAVFPFEAAEQAYDVCFGGDEQTCQELVEAEATHFSSWDDLDVGFEAEELSFGEKVTHAAYWSGDGQHFQEVEYPFPPGFLDQVFSLSNQVAVSISGAGGSQLFVSDDARSWRPLADVPSLGWITAMGEVDGNVVIVGQSPQGDNASVFRAPDVSGPWEEIALEDLLGIPPGDETFVWATAATVGDSGVAINLSVEQVSDGRAANPVTAIVERAFGSDAVPAEPEAQRVGTTGIMLLSRDLTSWSAVPSSDLGGHVDSLLTAPDGRLVAHASGVDENGQPLRRQYSAQP
jgi:hypothetical protein